MTIIPRIRNMERENWNITSAFRKYVAPGLNFNSPLSTTIGLSDDMKRAGYDPEMTPVTRVRPSTINRKDGSDRLTERLFWVNELNDGNNNATRASEMQTAINATSIDSPINWLMSWRLPAPTTL